MRKTITPLISSFLLLLSVSAFPQQVADTLYNPIILNPAYVNAQGPVVLIDEAHGNFHTLSGRFKPFARLLERDGYVVRPSAEPFTKDQLRAGKILVIANALHPDNLQRWTLPTPSAFTETEINVVNEWVSEGGCLFLIADHMPFPGAAEALAASFGFKFYNGFAMKKGGGKDIFSIGEGLIENVITNGRDKKEAVTSLQSFAGQAFEIPNGAHPIITLNSTYRMLMPQTAWEFTKDTPATSAENLVQGAYMNYGKGRVVVFGEAAMFTAQLQGKSKVGMNVKSAEQNFQFVLNAIHWLDGILE